MKQKTNKTTSNGVNKTSRATTPISPEIRKLINRRNAGKFGNRRDIARVKKLGK